MRNKSGKGIEEDKSRNAEWIPEREYSKSKKKKSIEKQSLL